ncbi:titin-like [Arapaima gigas]
MTANYLISSICYLSEPPTIDLDFRDKVIVRVGETCTLQGRYTGKPTPTIVWTKDDGELKEDDHILFRNTSSTLCLSIMNAKREYSGSYSVVVENNNGSRKGVCNVIVVDRPQPPVGPVVFDEVFRGHMIISWKPPLDDGGSAISNYIVEKRDTNRDLWMPVTSSCTRTSCKVPKLIEGREYIIRICAQNMYGISDPLLSKEMKAKDMYKVPEAPKQPVVKEVYKDSVLLTWEPPRDGGKPITNYILEKKETMLTRWSRAVKDRIYPDTEYWIPDLLEGCEYEFRVMAENEIGVGDPSPPSKPIFARDPVVIPGPPIQLEAVDKTKNSVTLFWQPPLYDGRGKILGYLVEYQKAGQEEWIKANQTPDSCQETKFKIISLTDGDLYRFRVMAVNAAGISEPAYIPEPVRAQDRLEPPELLLDASMAREVRAMAGTHIVLRAGIKGMPFPKVTWKKNDADVPPRADIKVTGVETKLEMRFCVRSDCGDYTLTVENPAGSKTATCTVLVLDKPGPPQNLKISDVRSDSAYLSWKDPEDSGGVRITNFVVEKKDITSAQWVPVCSSSKKRSMTAKHLMEGTQYMFRVAAENQFGRSEYVETTKPIKAMNPLFPPGPPKNLHHVDADKTEVWLQWNWPDRTGGSDITGFLVEYQEEGEKDWITFKTVSIPESHVTGLQEGKTYRFRVKAENAVGLSRPDTTVPVLCQEKLVPPIVEVDVKLIEDGEDLTMMVVAQILPII